MFERFSLILIDSQLSNQGFRRDYDVRTEEDINRRIASFIGGA